MTARNLVWMEHQSGDGRLYHVWESEIEKYEKRGYRLCDLERDLDVEEAADRPQT